MKTIKSQYITKTCLYNFDPLQPHFYTVKLGFTGVYIIFLISAQKHRLWVLCFGIRAYRSLHTVKNLSHINQIPRLDCMAAVGP